MPVATGPEAGRAARPSSAWPRTRGRRESGDGADRRAERVAVDQAPLRAPLEVGPQGGRRAGDGGLRIPAGGQEGQVAAEQDPVDIGRALGAPPAGPLGEPLDVRRVGPHRGGRQSAHRAAERLDLPGHRKTVPVQADGPAPPVSPVHLGADGHPSLRTGLASGHTPLLVPFGGSPTASGTEADGSRNPWLRS